MSPAPAGFERPRATRLRLTASGRLLLVLTLGVWISGWLGPGVARALAAVGVATLLVAALLALAHTRGLELLGPPPARGPVGSRLVLALGLRSQARILVPSDLLFALGEAGPDVPAPAGFFEGRLAPGIRPVTVAWRVRRRGTLERFRVLVSSAHPLGLVAVTRAFEVPARLLGLPRRGRLTQRPGRRHARRNALRGLRARGEEELSHVRDWREGESLHRLHWRLSARRGRPVLRELRAPTEADVELCLATHVPGLGQRRGRRAAFERAVSLAATLAEHHLRLGRRLTLSVEGEASLRALHGRQGLARVLTRLAGVEPRADAPDTEHAPARTRGTGVERVLVRAGGGVLAEDAAHPREARDEGVRILDVDAPPGHRLHAAWHAGGSGPR